MFRYAGSTLPFLESWLSKKTWVYLHNSSSSFQYIHFHSIFPLNTMNYEEQDWITFPHLRKPKIKMISAFEKSPWRNIYIYISPKPFLFLGWGHGGTPWVNATSYQFLDVSFPVEIQWENHTCMDPMSLAQVSRLWAKASAALPNGAGHKWCLVGGWTNPSEIYARQIGSFPQG